MMCIRNGKGALVCKVDPKTLAIEIVRKHERTLVELNITGQVSVLNTSLH